MVLKEMTAIRGVSGDEALIRKYIREKAEKLADDVRVDKMGNVFAYKRGTDGARHVILCAHMDEVGFIISGIQDNGLLSYMPVGFIDPRVVISKPVRIGKNACPGIIGAKAIHLQSADEMTRVLGHNDLSIDIGAKDKAAAEELVNPGDYVSFSSEWVEYGDGLVKSRALDDRVGCYALLRVLENTYPADVTCIFTVQEEVGLRGARVASKQIKADCAIILEGTSANDLGDAPDHLKVCRVGGGVAVSFMDLASVAHLGLHQALKRTAAENNIPWQYKTYVSGGNDTGPFQTAQGALPTCVLSVPCRYIHSPSNVAKFSDIDAQYGLVNAFLKAGAAF